MWYLRLNVKIFVLWPSGVFVLVHLHFSSPTLTHSRRTSLPTWLNLSWQCQELNLSHLSKKEKQKKRKTEPNVYEIYCKMKNTSSLGSIQSERRSVKGCSVWMSENTFDTLFLQRSDCVPGKKKPCTCTWPNNIALLITSWPWPWNLVGAASRSLLSACSTSVWLLFT